MKSFIVIISLCALFGLALITVRLKTRETLLRYEIAKLEKYEVLLIRRIGFRRSEEALKKSVVNLLERARELNIDLVYRDGEFRTVPILAGIEDGIQ